MLAGMHPYRRVVSEVADDAQAPAEELVLAVVMIALGVMRVAVAFVCREELGAEVTAAALLGAIGVAMAISCRRRRRCCRCCHSADSETGSTLR